MSEPVNEPLSEQLLMPCWVCGKCWQRKDVNKYYYFRGMLVCCSHYGAEEWYDSALKLADTKYTLKENNEDKEQRKGKETSPKENQ